MRKSSAPRDVAPGPAGPIGLGGGALMEDEELALAIAMSMEGGGAAGGAVGSAHRGEADQAGDTLDDLDEAAIWEHIQAAEQEAAGRGAAAETRAGGRGKTPEEVSEGHRGAGRARTGGKTDHDAWPTQGLVLVSFSWTVRKQLINIDSHFRSSCEGLIFTSPWNTWLPLDSHPLPRPSVESAPPHVINAPRVSACLR